MYLRMARLGNNTQSLGRRLQNQMIWCPEQILPAWWYLSVLQDDPSMLVHACLRSLFFFLSKAILACWYAHISASRHYFLPLFIRSSVFAWDVIYLSCCYSFLIYSSFIGRILFRNYKSFMYQIHLPLTRYTYLWLNRSHSALVHVLDSVSIHLSAIYILDLSLSCITFICQTHLCSFISHRACSLLASFSSSHMSSSRTPSQSNPQRSWQVGKQMYI